MTERATVIQAFLETTGWGEAERSLLAGDASFRTYDRLNRAGEPAVLMDAPPPEEDIRPFIAIAEHLTGLGYSAPRLFAKDVENGLLLLEDLGDDTFTRLLAKDEDEEALYTLAVDFLADLHQKPVASAIPQGLAPYDKQRLMDEALLLTDWYMPAAGIAPDTATRDAYIAAWDEAFSFTGEINDTIVLRDFHVDNLLRLEGRTGLAQLGLLDFQDALAGSPAYDLMSLLEDARRDIDKNMIDRLLARYFKAFPDLDQDAFLKAYAILGAGRHAKVIGIFTRLCVRDGKAQYLYHIPRVWRLLERSLAHPALTPVAQWIDQNISPANRGIPECPNQTQA